MKPVTARTFARQIRNDAKVEHPAPWWYRLAAKYFPERCREIPEAVNPDRIVLRQVAIWPRHVYLQQFASSESERAMHSHQWHRTLAIGLYGAYVEKRMAGPEKLRRAPYFYTMDASVIHRVSTPSAGHTSIFIGLWRDDDLKMYFGTPRITRPEEVEVRYKDAEGGPWTVAEQTPLTLARTWEDHIRVKVKRI